MKNSEATTLIETAYESLGYSEAEGISLFAAQNRPGALSENVWVDKGDWLSLAHEVGANKIFFVENNPVAVFARLDTDDDEILRKFYNRVWSMARPRWLFLAKPGELAVYDLAKRPPKSAQEFRKLQPLEAAESAAKVAEKLKRFRREELESGRVFEAEYLFGDIKNRADQALIHDLKEVRRELIETGLGGEKLKFAHALIGRSIFIRYLEEREILTRKTFDEVARKQARWKRLLENPPNRSGLDFSETPSLYLRVLEDKDFCFALFRKLADDFNGDMFPELDKEEEVIKQDHLRLIQDLLFGDAGRQKSLFFYAYQFKIIPIELISSIYEEFYQEENGGGHKYGAFYTPPALVDFVLAQTLTPERLATSPCIMDPACGSGIFLVESFRRIVRYRVARQGRRLRFDELQKILHDQLRGIDINPEAIRVAAFSLYLSLLHYLEPPDIREQIKRGNRLPNLVVDDEKLNLVIDDKKPKSFNVLLAANAFNAEMIESHSHLKERFSSSCADVVVGNPPWGSPGPKNTEARQQNKVAMKWCEQRRLPVGDQERSQAFIWRALDMLESNGVAGLLVSSGVFFKHHENSVAFRRKWLESCTLDSVFNFAHTRHVFFKGVDSPFAAVKFQKEKPNDRNRCVHYWSSKRTGSIEKLQSVVFSRNDVRLLQLDEDLPNYRIWKTLWWGNHRDWNLISFLQNQQPLSDFTNPDKFGQGYKEANQAKDADWLRQYKSLPIECFHRYRSMDFDALEDIPSRVESRGVREVYEGMRLLVKRGIEEKSIPKGQIIARLEERPFCFTNAIHGVKLSEPEEWKYKIILGILWSSLARYYFFLSSGNWGIWHHEIHLEDELLSLPICFPQKASLKNRIIEIVETLRIYDPPIQDLTNPNGVPENEIQAKRRELEAQLDDAIFELYGLGETEIDLIRDMCDTNLDFYYLREKSEAAKPILPKIPKKNHGAKNDLPEGAVGDYLRIFMQSWLPYLNEGTEFHWRVHQSPKSDSMLAAVFSVKNIGENPIPDTTSEDDAWKNTLRRLDEALLQPVGSRVYIDGLVRAVSDEEIIIIKRNEKRLWTKSMAREDAEATLVQAMNRNQMGKGR